jgi:type III pantothenate kinase
MLLVIDIGNTETELGLFPMLEDGTATPELVANWRISTSHQQTIDEYGVLIRQLFALRGLEPGAVKGIIVASVVPPLESLVRQMCERYFGIKAVFVEPGIKTGMPVLVDNPAELGADRLADSIGAYERYGGPCIVVDFGTATKFEVISARGEYLGGVIAPGLGLSAEALFSRAARLSRVEIKRPAKVIGTSTAGHLQSGLYYGFIGLVDGILDRIIAELGAELGTEPGAKPRVIASGGLAQLIAGDSRYIAEIDDMLTLDGLRILFERNRTAKPRGRAR